MSRLLKVLPFALALAVVASAIFLASCNSNNTQMRLVNGIPNGPNLDVTLNGSSLYTNIGFETTEPSSGYKGVSSGGDAFVAYPTGTTTNPVISSSLNLGGGNQYTVVMQGLDGSTGSVAPATSVFTDNNTAPTSGKSNIRVINVSTFADQQFVNNGAVDVYLVPPGTPLNKQTLSYSGLTYGQSSGYLSIGAPSGGTLELDITVSGSTVPLFTQDYSVNPSGGQIRTIILVDITGGGNISNEPIVLTDLN